MLAFGTDCYCQVQVPERIRPDWRLSVGDAGSLRRASQEDAVQCAVIFKFLFNYLQ